MQSCWKLEQAVYKLLLCFNSIKPSGNYFNHLIFKDTILSFVHSVYLWALYGPHCTARISLNSINQLIFVTVKCCVLFEVRMEFLNIIQTILGFKRDAKFR
jgi:hypothetical protein